MRIDSGSRLGCGGEAVTRSISCKVTRREKSAIPARVTPAMARVTRTKRRRRLTLTALLHPLITGAEDGADERGLCGIALNLAAQVGDVNVHGALRAGVIPAEDARQQIGASKDAAGRAAEGF